MDTEPPAVELRGITKRFPGVVANSDVNLSVRRGTIHAIVGENGAGKSTLMKILYGMQPPDEGEIIVNGTPQKFTSPQKAIDVGIGMVHQHFMLADNFTVTENVVLGAEKLYGIGARAEAKIREISDRYGLGVRPGALVEDLGVGDRQRVEILKVLYRGAQILILDEPTAVLVPQEVDELFRNLRELVREGLTVLFISHKLDEVRAVADEITVIRRGTTVGSTTPDKVTARELATMMVGSELPSPEARESTVTDVPVLVVDGLTVRTPDGRALIEDISFTIHKGEVVGIAGVEGNGQAELAEAILGMRVGTGTISLDGVDIAAWPTRQRREGGVGYIPEDRQADGFVPLLGAAENISMTITDRIARFGLVGPKRREVRAAPLARRLSLVSAGLGQPVRELSGGNQQKVTVARALASDPVLIVAITPTRGVDVASKELLLSELDRITTEAGASLLLASDELDDLVICDRVVVLVRGEIFTEFTEPPFDREALIAATEGLGAT